MSSEFVGGNLTLSWNQRSEDSKCYDVLITRNTTPDRWTTTNDTTFTIGDVILYDRIKILVRIGRSENHIDYEMEYRGMVTFLGGDNGFIYVHSLQLTLIVN